MSQKLASNKKELAHKPGSVVYAKKRKSVVIYLAPRLLVESSGKRPSAEHGI